MTHRAFDGYVADQTVNGVDGYDTAIRAQSATGTNTTGGDLILSSGKGTANPGVIKLQAGHVNRLVIDQHGFNLDGYLSLGSSLHVGGDLRVDGYSSVGSYSLVDGYQRVGSYISTDGYLIVDGYTLIDGYQITFDGYSEAPLVKQLDMPVSGLDGYHMTIQAQSSTNSPARGGNLLIKSGAGYNGDGYFRDGYVQLYSGSTEYARVVPNKFQTLAGQRVNISMVASTPFDIPDGYYAIMVDTSGAAITLNLPIYPIPGDTFQIKDMAGNASGSTITIYGGGYNIDASSTATITNNFGSKTFTFNGTAWNVMSVV